MKLLERPWDKLSIRRHWAYALAFAALALIGALRYFYLQQRLPRSEIVQDVGLTPSGALLGPLTEGMLVSQALIAAPSLAGFEIAVQHAGAGDPATFRVRVHDEARGLLREARVTASATAMRVRFAPLDAASPAPLFLDIDLPAPVSAPVFLPLSDSEAPDVGVLRVGEVPHGRRLVFSPVYAPPLGGVEGLRFIAKRETYVIVAAIALLVGACARRLGASSVVLAYGLVAAYYAVVRPPFGIHDESAHFGYIAFLMQRWELPLSTMTMPIDALAELNRSIGPLQYMPLPDSLPFYEAVQPPLYYVVSAVVGRLVYAATGSMAIAFYALRLLGVGMVACGVYFAVLCYRAVRQCNILPISPALFSCALASITLSPLFVHCTTGLSNDQLTVCLGGSLFYLILQCALTPPGVRQVAVMGVVGGLLWLTKFTGLFIVLMPGVLLIALRRWRLAAMYASLVVLMAAPLHFFNFRHYAALTGSKAHVDFVLAITNPQRLPIPLRRLLEGGAYDYFLRFLQPVQNYVWLDLAMLLMSCTLAAGCFLLVALSVGGIARDGLRTFQPRPSPGYVYAVTAAGCVLPFLTVCALSVQTRIWMVTSRYGYPSLFCYAFALCVAYSFIFREPTGRYVAVMSVAVAVVATAYALGTAAI